MQVAKMKFRFLPMDLAGFPVEEGRQRVDKKVVPWLADTNR